MRTVPGREGWSQPSPISRDVWARRSCHLLGVLLAVFAFASCSRPPAEEGRKIKLYQSPMHPWITSDKPGNCTICGMALTPVYEGDKPLESRDGLISLHGDSVNVLGVTTVPVRRIELTRALRFSGILEDDENFHRVIAAFYDGRIEQVNVQHVGQHVEKGEPLASLYSPELLYVVRELQNAMRGKNDTVARNSAQRLIQYGLTSEQVAAIAKQPDTVYTVDLLAPISGTVLTKKAYKGQYIKTGEPLFEMGDLARLWFHAEVYERDLADIRLGQKAILRTPTVPGREFEGVVTFVDPNFDARTRSTKVRIEVDNPPAEEEGRGLRRLLPHRAYAEASILADAGETLVAPRSAVLRDGRREVIYLDSGEGKYEQRSVKTGRVGDEGIEILEGLKEGDKVVTQGNLMIDAEAQLRSGVVSPVAEKPSLPPQKEAEDFLRQLARVSAALAAEDTVAVVREARPLRDLAAAIPAGPEVQTLKTLPDLAGGDLGALRQSFLPWSLAGAELSLALQRGGQKTDLHVFECPMTGDSFPGAPEQARWVQSGTEALNPYLGSAMLNCGAEVKP